MLSNPEEEEILQRTRYSDLDNRLTSAHREASRLMDFTKEEHNFIKKHKRELSLAVLEEKLLDTERTLPVAEEQGQIAQETYDNMVVIVSNGIVRANSNNNADWKLYWLSKESILHLWGNAVRHRADGQSERHVGKKKILKDTLEFVSKCKYFVEEIRLLLLSVSVSSIKLDTDNKRRTFYLLYSKYKQVYKLQDKPNEILKIPNHFMCPLSLDIMINPVYSIKSINTGIHKHSYEKSVIMEWLVTQRKTTDPKTREPLKIADLIDDTALIEEIEGFKADLQNVVTTYEASHGIIDARDASNDADNFACGKKCKKRRQRQIRQTRQTRQIRQIRQTIQIRQGKTKRRIRQVTIGKKSKKQYTKRHY